MANVVRRLLIMGRVQRVGYRVSCAREADRLGVNGSVRNLEDGSVEVIASGPAEAVGQLIEWCRQGPPGARVKQVFDEPAEATDVPVGTFQIRV